MELIRIRDKIFQVRGHNVILDFDLAGLYDMQTRSLRDTVGRHLHRFPADFMFTLTREEWAPLRKQFLTTKIRQRPFPIHPPYAFMEQGTVMLSGLLNTARAIEMNITIIRSFVALRQSVPTHKDLLAKIEALEKQHQTKYDDLHQALQMLIEQPVAVPSAFIGIRRTGKGFQGDV